MNGDCMYPERPLVKLNWSVELSNTTPPEPDTVHSEAGGAMLTPLGTDPLLRWLEQAPSMGFEMLELSILYETPPVVVVMQKLG